MSEHLQFFLLGLGNGAVYAALALALVVTYRSSGVINFATGAMALYTSYTYAYLRRDGDVILLFPGLPTTVSFGGPMSFVVALVISMAISALLGLVLYALIFRPLRAAPPLASAVASLGVLVVIQSMIVVRLGTRPVNVKAIFPRERWTFGGVRLSQERFWFAVTIVATALVISAVFRYTRFGMATEAVAETEKGAVVSGIRPQRIAAINWMISGMVAGIAGILISPITPLTPIGYTLFIVPALAAATTGRFQLLLPAVATGIAVGLLQAETELLKVKYSWFPSSGAGEIIPLVIILVTLVISGKALPQRGALIRQSLGAAPRPRNLWQPTVVGVAVATAALLATSGTWRSAVIGSMITAIIALSLVVVTGYAGQVSLAQLALAGTAAFSLSTITQDWGIPFPFAPLLAALVSTVIGVIIGLPAVRVRGLTLGIVTLSLALAIEAFWFRNQDFVSSSGARVRPPRMFGVDLGIGTGADFPRLRFGFMVLLVLVVVALGVASLRRSRFGSAMLAVRANERSAAASGVNVVRVKLLSFAIASFIAGIGGALLAYRRGAVSFDSFTALGGLTLFSTVYLAGITSVSGGLLSGAMAVGGLIFIAMDRWLDFGRWYDVITGVLLVFTVIMNPEGIVGPIHAAADKRAAKRKARLASSTAGVTPADSEPVLDGSTASADTEPAHRGTRGQPEVLALQHLSVVYGGVRAVDDVSFEVPAGSIVGLIGPNGAGKTSLIDAVTGFATSTGNVLLGGRNLAGLPPHRRVDVGLSRTFQAIELYDDLSVDENIMVGLHNRRGGSDEDVLVHALATLDILELRDRAAGDLSQGQRQLVSIARALVAQPSVLLLDEPAAGLDSTESMWLGRRLRAVRDGGVTILLVDHDVGLVFDVCDSVHVLDFGCLIASGDADTVRRDPRVAAAYLGATHDVAVAQ